MFRVQEAPTTTLCVGFSTGRCFLAQEQAENEVKLTFTSLLELE
jgi:hypothetical protein